MANIIQFLLYNNKNIKVERKITANVERKITANVEPKITANVERKITANVERKITANVAPKITANVEPMYNKKYYSIYKEPYKPPSWIGNENYQLIIAKCISYSAVYHDNENLKDIKDIAYKREPTNIEYKRLYDKNILKDKYGYEICPYNETLHPNIAIYCKTPMYMSPNGEGTPKYINILSVIAPAFDVVEQPDYKRYLSLPEEKRQSTYKDDLSKMFRKICSCFIYDTPKFIKFKTLIMHGVGMGNFKSKAESLGIDAEKIFIDCCVEFFKPIFSTNKDKTLFLNFPGHQPMITQDIINKKFDNPENIKYIDKFFPAITEEFSQIELDTTLIINAWDPFSIVGNGNAGDNSLDGYIGKHTAAGLLSWPAENKQIYYKKVDYN